MSLSFLESFPNILLFYYWKFELGVITYNSHGSLAFDAIIQRFQCSLSPNVSSMHLPAVHAPIVPVANCPLSLSPSCLVWSWWSVCGVSFLSRSPAVSHRRLPLTTGTSHNSTGRTRQGRVRLYSVNCSPYVSLSASAISHNEGERYSYHRHFTTHTPHTAAAKS